MTEYSDAIRHHHAELRRALRAHLRRARNGSSSGEARAFVAFLSEELIPHAVGEERALYPVMDEVVRGQGRATRTMSLDHERIRAYVRRLSRLVAEGPRARRSARPGPGRTFDRLALELGAILELHFDKENRAYLPLFDRFVSRPDQAATLARMHDSRAPRSRGDRARRGGARRSSPSVPSER